MLSFKFNKTGVGIVIQKANSFLLTKDPWFGFWDFPNIIFDDELSAEDKVLAVDSVLNDMGIPSTLAAKRKSVKKVIHKHSCTRNIYAVEYLELNSPIDQENVTKEIKWLTEEEIRALEVSPVTKKLLNAIKTYHKKLNKTSLKRKIEDSNDSLIPSLPNKKSKTVKNNDESIDDISFCDDVNFELIEEIAVLTAIKEIYTVIQNQSKKFIKTTKNSTLREVRDISTSKEKVCDSVKKAVKTLNEVSPKLKTGEKTLAVSPSPTSIKVSESVISNNQPILNSSSVKNTSSKGLPALPTTSKIVLDAVENVKMTLTNGNTGVKRPLSALPDVIECKVVENKNINLNKTCLNVPVKKSVVNGKSMKQTSIMSFFGRK